MIKSIKSILVVVLITGIIVLISFILENPKATNQHWLASPLSNMVIKNRISGKCIQITDVDQVSQIISLLKSIEYLDQKPEETIGLGYSVKLDYKETKVEYYFATPYHLFITKDNKAFGEYFISESSGRPIFNLLEKLSNTSNKSRNNTKNKLTLDEIKQSSVKTDERILSTKEYKDYLLVESQAPTLANRFTLYNLLTGDKDNLPSGAEFIDSAKIIDANNIILYAKGTSSESTKQVFPYEIDCVRGLENNNSEGDFTPIYKDIELPVNKAISLNGKEKEEINNIRVTVNGLQVCFGPQSGSESSFYADYLDIPTTDISYDEKTGEFTLKFHDTTLGKTLSNTSPLSYQNIFIKSLKFKESDNCAVVIVKINKTSKYFIGKKSSIDVVENGVSFLDIQFTGSNTD